MVLSSSNTAPQHSAFTPQSIAPQKAGVFGTIKSAFFNKHETTSALSAATLDAPAPTVQTVEDYVEARGGNRPIRKVLIANNGMAATKSIMSMRQWAYMEFGDEKAIQFIAMATPEDLKANAEFIRLADSFVEVPGGKNLNNYANVEVITKIAQEQGVDAVWPGWVSVYTFLQRQPSLMQPHLMLLLRLAGTRVREPPAAQHPECSGN